MASIVLLAHPAKFTPQQFNDSLKSMVESRTNLSNLPSVLPQVDATKIKQCVFGPNHIAFLMDNGRVCRARFQLNPDSTTTFTKDTSSDEDISAPTCAKKAPTSSSTNNPESSGSSQSFALSGEALSNLSGQLSRWTHSSVSTYAPNVTIGPTPSSAASVLASRVITARGRGRIIRAARGRNGSGWLSNRAVIPASSVPEELISQAQIVLQGKSRQVIIRELQRTSLDVNLAVNNLLSRDDNDPDDDGEDYIQEAYIPSEDLISIFETGIPNDEPFIVQRDDIFPDNNFYQTSGSGTSRNEYRGGGNTGNHSGEGSSSRDIERDEDLGNHLQVSEGWWSEGSRNSTKDKQARNSQTPKAKITTKLTEADTEHVFDEIVWWRFKENDDDSIKFSHIAALQTELLAVTENGFLHRWKWIDNESPITEINGHCYPRTFDLQLTNDERITKIAACNVRVSILTESGKIATWLDETLAPVGQKLEHPLQTFIEFKNNTVQQLQVCDHYSCVQLSNNAIYWWGVFPFDQRKKVLDKVKAKAKKSAISGSGLIKPDTQVCIRSCPLYYPGAIGFTTVNGQPRVGELKEQAWTISEKCRFKILSQADLQKRNSEIKTDEINKKDNCEPSNLQKQNEESIDATENGVEQERKRSRKRKAEEQNSDPKSSEKIEEWSLRDVIFVEEVRSVPIGRVLKVDGAYVLVHFSPDCNNEQALDKANFKSLLSESRLLRKDELQIVKWTTPPKMPECFQKVPKQLNIPRNSKALAVTLDKKGIHAILKSPTGLRYTTFDLASGRAGLGGQIQTEPSSFLSKTNSLSLHTAGTDSIVLLKDPNSCLYPLIKDSLGGIQKPYIANMLPVKSLTMNQHFDDEDVQMNLTLFVLKENLIVKSILKKDSVVLMHELKEIDGKQDLIDDLVSTKCDGNRNIFHICVSTCEPQLVKQSKMLNSISTLGLPPLVPIDKAGDLIDGPFNNTTLWEPLYNGLACLEILINNPVLSNYTKLLLSEKDAFGFTPFMAAIQIRAYSAACKIYDAALWVSKEEGVVNEDVFMSMICPPDTDSDISPLQVICFNDTCSFTWTGTRHINQDIFECKTCGLVGPLCCCTECAQVCHIGHECKLKKTSPTAYCDCWEKCPCKSLVSGDQEQRAELLHRLVDNTNLATKPDKKGQHIFLFLVKTVSRQSLEQTQYVPSRMSSEGSKSRLSNSRGRVRSQSPPIDYELEPPKFAKASLLYMLKNWQALKSMIMFGKEQKGSFRVNSLDENVITSSLLHADDMVKNLNAQKGTSALDNFVHILIGECRDLLDTLVQTLIDRLASTKRSNDEQSYEEAITVTKRFVHAVIRVYVALSACTSPSAVKRRGVQPLLLKCKNVFISLKFISTPELANVASAVFSPVRMGVVYPSTPFMLGSSPDSLSMANDLFSMSPLPGRSSSISTSAVSRDHPRVRFADNNLVDEINEDMETENSSQNQPNEEEQGDNSQSHGGESDMELDLMAESESDSDESNHGDTQSSSGGELPSVSGESSGRRGRSGADGYFTTAEASETEGEDEEGIEDDENEDEEEDDDDDDDDEETGNHEETTDQRSATGIRDNSTAPNSLQWAVRNTQNTLQSSSTSLAAAHLAGSGLIFIDPAQFRRSASAASVDGATPNTMYCTSSALARTFGCLIREISDILNPSTEHMTALIKNLPSKFTDEIAMKNAKQKIDDRLRSTWDWLWNVMETTEAQLRFGASLTTVSDPNHPQHPLYDSQNKNIKPGSQRNSNNNNNNNITNQFRSFGGDNRRKKRAGSNHTVLWDATNGRQDYLTYVLSLIRSLDNEHADSLPKIEITSLRHVAFVLDAFIYYLRATKNLETISSKTESEESKKSTYQTPSSSKKMKDDFNEFRVLGGSTNSGNLKSMDDNDDDDDDDDDPADEQELVPYHTTIDGKTLRQTFFKRSDSTLVLGHEPSDPISTPLKEALPLAERPHLLHPNSRRDQLFGVMKNSSKSDFPEPSLSMKLNADSKILTEANTNYLNMSPNIYLGRWSMCLELFGRVFLDDVGCENNSILNELGRYEVKESKFKRDMEKFRNCHQKELYIEGLDRSRPLLIQQSLRQLNAQFGRRVPGAGPLNIHRFKVSFKDEEGEGSGVARGFYTAICNAFLADENLPNLDNIFSGSKGLTHHLRARAKERERERRRTTNSNLAPGLIPRAVRRNDRSSERVVAELENCVLSLDAPAYVPADQEESEDEHGSSNPITHHKRGLERRIYRKANSLWPGYAGKITGMLLELTPTQLMYLLTHEQAFKDKINEAADLIASSNQDNSQPSSQDSAKSLMDCNNKTDLLLENENEVDNLPLFFQPGKPGFYSPRPGKNTPQRINCFRNAGRVIGLCLLQNDICPLSLNRHVIKYLLGRRISWHDLAFFDPTLYESFRQLIADLNDPDNNDVSSMLDLTYSVQLRPEEGGGTVDLVNGGSQVEVGSDNVMDFVKRYAEYRMVTNSRKALQAMRRGLLDVIPSANLDGLTAEDFRLLLNGSGEINVKQLMSYTTFSDETGGEGQEKLSKFKKWFWSMVENMTTKQKQDLLYFWTSTPAMPASAEGFQPMPSVTVKPANDHQLPTANTCISRLYVPLYTSKSILRSKFLLAIKSKIFGFV